jgi:signal transduction histidine kinase
MGKLSAGVAHEIRNPLNAMKGAITYLKKHQGNDQATAEFTQLILEEINRLSRFVNEFLHYAKLSAPKPVPADVNELIANTISLYSEELRVKQITLSKHLQSGLPVIPIDVKQMEQVLVNILINAIDSYQHPGSIKIRSHYQEQTIRFFSKSAVVITITDSGAGIPADHLKNIFDPFFSTKENGTGLGLPISLNIVENHGGMMTITSKENVGTEVVIVLPSAGTKNGIGESDETENPDRG